MTIKKNSGTLEVLIKPNEDAETAMARLVLAPETRNAFVASTFATTVFGEHHTPSASHDVEAMHQAIAGAAEGSKTMPSRILASQAIALDAMFTELARRSKANMGEYLEASEKYMRLALKAQSNCRVTLDALAKLHQPREQTVKHVQVNDGGQAVVADQFHQHNEGGQNEKSGKQSHATGTAGESAAMLSKDPEGSGVPISSRKGAQAVQDARGD